MEPAKNIPCITPESVLDHALCYLSLGWSVIPIKGRDKTPAIATWKEYQTRQPTVAEVEQWFARSQYNIGIVTGAVSGITVLDIDDLALVDDVKSRGAGNPLISVTGRGAHFSYAYDEGIKTTTAIHGIKGLDIRNDGAYIVAPPSIHQNGKTYTFDNDLLTHTLTPPPQWLIPDPPPPVAPDGVLPVPGKIDLLVEIPRLRSALEHIPAVDYGQWLKVGMALHALGQEGFALWDTWSATCQDKYCPVTIADKWQTFDESRHNPVTVGTIYHLAKKNGWQPEPQANRTDRGNAIRFAAAFGSEVRWTPEYKKWLLWDGRKWAIDDSDAIMQCAKAIPDQMINEARGLADDHRQSLIKHALATESKVRLDSMISLARTEPGIPLNQWRLDNAPYLLNVGNGTIDLKTGCLGVFSRTDYITKQVLVDYPHEISPCPNWLGFLEKIMGGNKAVIRYLQKAIGYSLSGSTKEQCLFFCYGTGANGKSTLLNVLAQILNDYAMHIDPATLMVKQNHGGATPELARLKGARLVMTSEVEEGQRLAESTIKQLTGGDTILVRNLYCDPFEYQPMFKLWIAGNHRPMIKGIDYAIWRRIHLLPFTVTIPAEEQDKNLGDKLRKELPGILAWAVAGFLLWQKEGLTPPIEIRAAVDAYREEMDTIGQWLAEATRQEKNAQTPASSLYHSYSRWCLDSGHFPLSQKRLGMALKEKGYLNQKKPNSVWLGLTVISWPF